MKKSLPKRRACRGETLTETLVAVLVVALSSAALASMLLASNRQNQAAMEHDAALYSQLQQAETREGAPSAGTVTIQLEGKTVELPVSRYGEADALQTYEYPVAGGGVP